MGIVNKFPVEIAAQIVYDPGDADISTSLIESYLEDWTKPDDYDDDPGRLCRAEMKLPAVGVYWM